MRISCAPMPSTKSSASARQLDAPVRSRDGGRSPVVAASCTECGAAATRHTTSSEPPSACCLGTPRS